MPQQVQSGSMCGGICRKVYLAALCPEGKCPDTSSLQEIYLDTPCLEGIMPWYLLSGRYIPWHSPYGKHMPWCASSGCYMA